MNRSRTLSREALDDLYLEWLYDHVGLYKRGRHRTYFGLFRLMYEKEFTWTLLKDSSRAENGKELRWQFVRAAGIPRVEAKWLYLPCSVLEMLVGVSKHCASLTDGNVQDWFHQLLVNLEFDQFSDMYVRDREVEVDARMNTLVRRNFSPTGEGGLFPLQSPSADQRGVEIWYQMHSWLMERARKEG